MCTTRRTNRLMRPFDARTTRPRPSHFAFLFCGFPSVACLLRLPLLRPGLVARLPGGIPPGEHRFSARGGGGIRQGRICSSVAHASERWRKQERKGNGWGGADTAGGDANIPAPQRSCPDRPAARPPTPPRAPRMAIRTYSPSSKQGGDHPTPAKRSISPDSAPARSPKPVPEGRFRNPGSLRGFTGTACCAVASTVANG